MCWRMVRAVEVDWAETMLMLTLMAAVGLERRQPAQEVLEVVVVVGGEQELVVSVVCVVRAGVAACWVEEGSKGQA